MPADIRWRRERLSPRTLLEQDRQTSENVKFHSKSPAIITVAFQVNISNRPGRRHEQLRRAGTTHSTASRYPAFPCQPAERCAAWPPGGCAGSAGPGGGEPAVAAGRALLSYRSDFARAGGDRTSSAGTGAGAEADSLFQTVGYVVARALDDEMPLHLSASTHPVVTAATDYPRTHLDRVTIAVGFDDVGAFARSLARHCGETPSAYNDESADPLESPAANGLPETLSSAQDFFGP